MSYPSVYHSASASFAEIISTATANERWKVYLVCLYISLLLLIAHLSVSYLWIFHLIVCRMVMPKTAATMEFMMVPIAAANRRKITRDKKKSEKQKTKYLHYKNWRKNSRFKRDKILQWKIREPNKSIVLVLHPQSTFYLFVLMIYILHSTKTMLSGRRLNVSFHFSVQIR